MKEDLINRKKNILVEVKNNETLMDAGKVSMFIDGIQTDDICHYELAPGEEKLIRFELPKTGYKQLLFTTKYNSVIAD